MYELFNVIFANVLTNKIVILWTKVQLGQMQVSYGG